MTEFEGLYTAVVESEPKEIKQNLVKIPSIHQQEALDSALEKSISLSLAPKVQNVKFLLELGADPNGPSGNEGIVLSYAYSSGLNHIVELLLQAGADTNADHSDVLEQAVRKGDVRYVVRFVEAGADINNKSRLLFVDDLLVAAEGSPEIQQYLISKGITAGSELKKNLANITIPRLSDYPGTTKYQYDQEHTPAEYPTEQLCVRDYSTRYFVVRGNTKDHQNLLRKNGGKFFPKLKGGKGWLLPLRNREIIENNMSQSKPTIPSPEQESKPKESPTPVYSDNSINRPIINNSSTIDIYTPIGEYGYMTTSYTHPELFYLDKHTWDSIERYLMYKMYEGSIKANAVRDANTLVEARKKFNVNTIITAKTPKQLVMNQKMRPLAGSKMNTNNLQHREKLFYHANEAKFSQNRLLRNRLLYTDNKEIITKNSHDIFGYEGNLLGNTLMKLRYEFGGPVYEHRNVSKTNSLIIRKYSTLDASLRSAKVPKPASGSKPVSPAGAQPRTNKSFYVIRGDPDTELATQLRTLGTYKTKTDKVIRGKLNLNLQGGAGWLVPYGKRKEAKKIVFNTYPDEKKIQICGQDWVKKNIKQFLEIAILVSRFRGRQEIGPDDLMFTIKDIYGREDFLGEENGNPSVDFIHSVWKYVEKQDTVISDAAIQLLWNFLSKMVLEITQNIETYDQMKEIMNNIDATILDTPIKPAEGLTERESIIVHSFTRLYKLLKKINNVEAKICVIVVHMMLGNIHYENIRTIYSKKAKMQTDTDWTDEENQFQRRFQITTPHIQAILDNLPADISTKCKLLVLTTLDYVMSLENENAITISKRLIVLSQKGTQPSPTPILPDESSDIPKPEHDEPEHDEPEHDEPEHDEPEQ
uniref:Ankyrin repeat protein n=1 Tax=Marseillevirus LCMAC201 TaxID=2506605 RepID=A0A481YVL1_9VIRU|nr:MAG: ankyrin repeat protein [Marseillevirus LCMAC201]